MDVDEDGLTSTFIHGRTCDWAVTFNAHDDQNNLPWVTANWVTGKPFACASHHALVYYVMVVELGDDTHRYHYHARLFFSTPVSCDALRKFIGPCHWGKTKSPKSWETYIRKHDQTWVAGPFQEGQTPLLEEKTTAYVLRRLKEGASPVQILQERPSALSMYRTMKELHTDIPRQLPLTMKARIVQATPLLWQTEVIAIIQGPIVPRRWIWIWSAETNSGKTSIGEYLISMGPGLLVMMERGFLPNLVKLWIPGHHRVIWCDVPLMEPIPPSTLSMFETISDAGYHQSTKYHSDMKLIEAHLIITTNQPPPLDYVIAGRIKEVHVPPRD
jgi:hypothetical protein